MCDPDGLNVHGGHPEAAFAALGVPPRPVVDFSASVCPLGPPDEVRRLWPGLLGELTHYPSVAGSGVARFFAQRFAIPDESVLAGNGSTECLYLVPRMLQVRSVAVVTPAFHDYGRACDVSGVPWVSVRLSEADAFSAPPRSVLEEALRNHDALLLGNPNNPTGTVFDADELLALADAFPDKWLWVDEAFMQFLPDAARYSLLAPDKLRHNVLIFQSLTKFYGLAGLRLGAVIGHPEVMALLRSGKEPWSVNRVAERVAECLPNCSQYEARVHAWLHAERPRMISGLAACSRIKLFPGSANFMLARWTETGELDDLLRVLLARGLHVRDARNFAGLESNYFRFALRSPEENDRLLAALGA